MILINLSEAVCMAVATLGVKEVLGLLVVTNGHWPFEFQLSDMYNDLSCFSFKF